MENFKTYFKESTNDFPAKIEELREKGFIIREGNIGGDDVVLVFPAHMGVEWDKSNLIYRSSVWTYPEGEPVSLSYKKFFNWGEKPGLVKEPTTLKNTFAKLKLDGSTLIVSKHKGELVARTRGTLDASQLDTGHEIDILKERYPQAFDNELINSEDYTCIYEWVSPDNIIVIDYGEEPDIFLTGIVQHNGYKMLDQNRVTEYGKEWGVKTPETFEFKDVDSMLKTIKDLKGEEGICLYFSQGQNIKKIKSVEYLAKHAFKSDVTPKNVIKMYVGAGMPDYNAFMNQLENDFDFECASMAKGLVSKVVDAKKEADKLVDHMRGFVAPLKSLPRREAAEKIIGAYGKTNRSGMAFMFLDDKTLDQEAWEKLLHQLIRD